jgi:hypothetical protein
MTTRQSLMNKAESLLEQINTKLDALGVSLKELLAVAPRSNAAWYQAQTETGQREIPTLNQPRWDNAPYMRILVTI